MRNTVQMMHDMKKQVVIEGVETKNALDTLISMSGDYIHPIFARIFTQKSSSCFWLIDRPLWTATFAARLLSLNSRLEKQGPGRVGDGALG